MEVERVRAELKQQGWGLARGVPFMKEGRPVPSEVLALAARFGRPSTRDGGRAVWPVRPSLGDPAATFSLRAGPAAFHTDAQYHRDPEPLVCLFVVRPARDGGDSMLLSARAAADRAEALSAVNRRLLSEPCWFWRPPAPYEHTAPAWRAPVFAGDGTVRWRADTLAPDLPRQVLQAGRAFAACLQDADATTIEQRAGDLLLIDNHRALHARTGFTDRGRLLLRVRLWT
ncbi:TauD/TfdA family dioxygenase [Nonomuraea sp. NPDC050556]|uniref:TauD/TfdA family dioxygenase n=1 Tax=Nonomuraea sp. NPDC050556 TaxID=3364369 RepID=UPI003790280F